VEGKRKIVQKSEAAAINFHRASERSGGVEHGRKLLAKEIFPILAAVTSVLQSLAVAGGGS
jgi:hypothetical protein